MARTDHLPIYKAAYDLRLHVEQAVREPWVWICGREPGVLKLIVRANARANKAPTLLEVREEVEALKAVLRLAHDV